MIDKIFDALKDPSKLKQLSEINNLSELPFLTRTHQNSYVLYFKLPATYAEFLELLEDFEARGIIVGNYAFDSDKQYKYSRAAFYNATSVMIEFRIARS